MRFEYPAQFEQQQGEFVVSFPDLPEALTSGTDADDAYREASDALGATLAGYLLDGLELPAPSKPRRRHVMVSPPPLVAAKLALRIRMQQLGLSNVALAERLGVSETVVRRLVNPDHESKLSNIVEALSELGQHLVVEVEDNRANAA